MQRIIAFLLIIFLLPVFIMLSILVWVSIGRPIFFRQERPGKSERIFTLIKYRSMLDMRDKSGLLLPDEKRLTKFSKLLRATSLDELPSLINIVKGDMAFVGPRPLLVEYLPLYSKKHKRRHDVLPGITGHAQINGRNSISWEKRLDLDIWYIDNRSFLLDLKIILSTIIKVLKSEGINQEGSATMPLFNGGRQKRNEN